MNIPNLLTLMRIVLIPVLMILFIQGEFVLALLVFTAAGVTDALDGLLARWLHQKTRIGAILDPLADKLLLTTSYVTLAVIGLLPDWLAVMVISRDVIIVVGVLILSLLQVRVEIRPSVLGKLTTLAQLGTIFFVLLHHESGWGNGFIQALFHATAGVTAGSGLHYMYLGVRLLGSVDNGETS